MLWYFLLFDSKGRARQNFGCEEVVNDQIKMELEAATTYLSLVIF